MVGKANGVSDVAPEEKTRIETTSGDKECATIWRCCCCIAFGFAITIVLILNNKVVRNYSILNQAHGIHHNGTDPFNLNHSSGIESSSHVDMDEDNDVEIKDDTLEDLEAERDKDSSHEDGEKSLGEQIEEVQQSATKESAEEEEVAEDDFGDDYDASPEKEKKWREYKTAFSVLAKYGRRSLKLGILPIWQEFQDKMAKVLNTLVSAEDRKPMKVLIAASVSGKPTSVQTLTSWANYFTKMKNEQLEKHGVADQVEFALNHYDNKLAPW